MSNPTGASFDAAALVGAPLTRRKREVVDAFEATYLTEVLRLASGNITEAARRAGLDRSNFRRLLKRYKV